MVVLLFDVPVFVFVVVAPVFAWDQMPNLDHVVPGYQIPNLVQWVVVESLEVAVLLEVAVVLEWVLCVE